MEKINIIYLNYILLYVLLVIDLILIKVSKNRYLAWSIKWFIFFIIIFNYTIAVGLRPIDSGNDTPRYVVAFLNISNLESAPTEGFQTFGSWEPLFWYLVFLLKLVSNNPQTFILILSTIIFLIHWFVISYILAKEFLKKYGTLTITLLFSTYYIVFTGNIIRQVLIVPLVFLSLWLAFYRKRLYSLIILILSFLVHISSLIFFPLLLFLLKNNFTNRFTKFKIIFALIVFSFIIALINFTLNNPNFITSVFYFLSDNLKLYIYNKIELYKNNKFALSNISTIFQMKTFLFSLGISFLFFLISLVKPKKINLFQKFLLVYSIFILGLLMLFYDMPQIADRLLPYYYFSLPFLVVVTLNVLKRFTYTLLLLVILFIFFIQNIFLWNLHSVRYTLGIP